MEPELVRLPGSPRGAAEGSGDETGLLWPGAFIGHPDTGGPYDTSKMRKRFKAALKTAGIRPVRFHDLRHSYGTAMAAAGTPLRPLHEWLGHKDHKTTEIYADYAPDPLAGCAVGRGSVRA